MMRRTDGRVASSSLLPQYRQPSTPRLCIELWVFFDAYHDTLLHARVPSLPYCCVRHIAVVRTFGRRVSVSATISPRALLSSLRYWRLLARAYLILTRRVNNTVLETEGQTKCVCVG